MEFHEIPDRPPGECRRALCAHDHSRSPDQGHRGAALIPEGALRWPNVPAVYNWLSLDRRARWRLRGTPVTHAATIGWFNRQYARDADGRYFVQNGPQRVYVELEYTPWILRLTTSTHLETHTGADAGHLRAAAIDEEGNLLLDTSLGLGLLDDRDLPRLLDCLRGSDGRPLAEGSAVEGDADDLPPGTQLYWQEQFLPLQKVKRAEMAHRFGFVASPAALSTG